MPKSLRRLLALLAAAGGLAGQQFMPDLNRPPLRPLPLAGPIAMATADIDGDGDEDAAVTDQQGVVLLRQAAGAWTRTTLLGGALAAAMAWADMDGDGDLDLVVGGETPYAIPAPMGVLRNDGAAFTWLGTVPAMVQARIVQFAVGDVDGDLDADVVVGGTPNQGMLGTRFLRLYRNNGAAGLTEDPAGLPAVGGTGFVPALLDFDGDNALDIAAARIGGGLVLLHNQGGVFADVSASLPAGAAAMWLAAGDLDADLDDDFVLLRQDGRVDGLIDQGGAFALATGLLVPGPLPGRLLMLDDFDGDGLPEVVLAGAQQLELHRNGGALTFVRDLSAAREATLFFVASVDTLGRGTHDLLTWWSDRAQLVYYNTPQGMLADPREEPGFAPQVYLGSAAAADLDGDGLVDLAMNDHAFGRFPGRLELHRNLGGGNFERRFMGFGSPEFDVLRVADLDGDARPDLVGVHDAWPVSTARLLRNLGQMTFAEVGSWQLQGSATDCRIGDADGDGDPDVLLCVGGAIHWLRNDPGGLVSAGALPGLPAAHALSRFLFVDMDGDQDGDFVLGSDRGAGCLPVVINNGAGSFTLFCAAFTGNVRDVAAADLDSDGDRDVVVIAHAAPLPFVFRNLGNGALVAVAGALPPLAAAQFFWSEPADVDGDGDVDLLVSGSPSNRLLANLGNGTFVDASSRLQQPSQSWGKLVWFDADGDGAQDALVRDGLTVETWLVRNRLRTIETLQAPRLGGTLQLRLVAEPGFAQGGTVCLPLLALATLPSPVAFPGVAGTLQVDPNGAGALGFVSLPAPAGETTLTVALPPTPAFAGMRLFVQGGYASPVFGFAFGPIVEELILP